MSVYEVLEAFYAWAEANALWILAGAVGVPMVGTIAAWIGKGGRTDADGRLIASLVVGIGLVATTFEVVAIAIAHSMLELDVLAGNALLLAAPVLCLLVGGLGVRLVFPLSELASVRSFADMALFVLACLAVVWVFGKFRGWGILFLGGITQLLVIGVLTYVLLRRLYRRAFGPKRPSLPRHLRY